MRLIVELRLTDSDVPEELMTNEDATYDYIREQMIGNCEYYIKDWYFE